MINCKISTQGIIAITRIEDVVDHLDTAIKDVVLVLMKMIEETEDIMTDGIEVGREEETEEVIATTAVPDLPCQAGNAITTWVAVIVVEEVVEEEVVDHQ